MDTSEILNIYEELNSLSPREAKSKFNSLRLTYKQWLAFTSSWEEFNSLTPHSEDSEEFQDLYSKIINNKGISFEDFRKAFDLNKATHIFGKASMILNKQGKDISACQNAKRIEQQYSNLIMKINPKTVLMNLFNKLKNLKNRDVSMENIDEFYEDFKRDKGIIGQLYENFEDLYEVKSDVDYTIGKRETNEALEMLEQRFSTMRDNRSLPPMELVSKIGISANAIIQYITGGNINSIQFQNGRKELTVNLSGEIKPFSLFLSDIDWTMTVFKEAFDFLKDTSFEERDIPLITNLQKKEAELSSLEKEEITISEAEALIDQQNQDKI